MARRSLHVFLFFFALLGGILGLAMAADIHSASTALMAVGCLAGALAMLPDAFPVIAEGVAAALTRKYAATLWLLGMVCMGIGHALQHGWL